MVQVKPDVYRPGTTYTLTATALPENALNKEIYWSSSDESVATVAGGFVSLDSSLRVFRLSS